MNIYMKILQDGVKQPIVLGLHRSDYMLHSVENDPRTFMQVELNTIASSFGALSSKVSEMHRVLSLSGSEDFSPLNNAHTEVCFQLSLQHPHHSSFSLPKVSPKRMASICHNEE
jgi:hypothetical protein